jgi:hypothetical protein
MMLMVDAPADAADGRHHHEALVVVLSSLLDAEKKNDGPVPPTLPEKKIRLSGRLGRREDMVTRVNGRV